MDHTDNFNSDEDASDLTVYFDNDYLLSGQEAQGQIFYFLLDEDAELAGNPNRLNNIDVDGIRFTIDTGNGPVDVTIESDAANTAGTHQGFVNALQAPLQALIQDGTLPAGTTLTLDPTITDVTFLDDGSQSDTIPAIVLTSGDGSEVIATGFSRIEEEIGEYDVYGRFNSVNEVEDQPISINIDLHKVGRGGDGGDLLIGGKAPSVQDGIAGGIEVFNINVLGAGNDDPNGMMTKPSSLGNISSTFGVLDVVNIATDPVYAAGDTYASLEVRDGFDGNTSLINADAFLGDLMLYNVTNADTITAQGGGDVALGLGYNGDEVNTAYSVTTAGGDDDIEILLDGDAVDYAGSSLNVATGAGDDDIFVNLDLNDLENEQLNQAILDNVEIDGGSGDDVIVVQGRGNANIMGGSGDDTIYTDGDGSGAVWAFNFDAVRQGTLPGTGPDDRPGEQLSLAYVGGATVTVTLSGAGVDGDSSAGGGVMTSDNDDPIGASAGQDGYEASSVISDLINGNDFYGDQRDVNAAIIDAIASDPILSQLLTATIGANNTLDIASTTSGSFDSSDLRIEIERPTLDSWTAVQTEARSVFSDSSIAVSSVADADTPTGQDLESSGGADAWFDGLSAAGDEANSTNADVGDGASNLMFSGSQAMDATDNVINGGDGDDLIVLSTSASGSNAPLFTVSSNNALLNMTSNETVVMDGVFGDDTVMNFQDGDYTPPADAVAEVATFSIADMLDGSEIRIFNASTSSITHEFVDTEGLLEAINTAPGAVYTATEADGTVTLTETTPGGINRSNVEVGVTATQPVTVEDGYTDTGDPVPETVTFSIADVGAGDTIRIFNAIPGTGSLGLAIEFVDAAGFVEAINNPELGAAYTASEDGGTVTLTETNPGGTDLTNIEVTFQFFEEVTVTDAIAATGGGNTGLDFLDFTAYLTSEEDVSTGTPDSTDSEQTIAVTLNHNPASAAPGADIQANEVVTIVYTDDTSATGTFANLSAADIEGLFSAVDFDGGALAAADFDVVDSQTDDQVVDGNGKAIIMVENAGNDGEYKVFELTWDASEGDGNEGVSAVEIGSLDFGDSLTDLDEVNLVGSDSHATLLETGFYGDVVG